MIASQLISKIDSTLNQLIKNAEALQGIDLRDLTETELAAFQKTQESLLHHLLHIDRSIRNAEEKKSSSQNKPVTQAIRERSLKIRRVKEGLAKTMEGAARRQPLFHKRRFKRLLNLS